MVFPQTIYSYGLIEELTPTPTVVPTPSIEPTPAMSNAYITMDLDKNKAAVGEIVDVKVRHIMYNPHERVCK